jgi:glycerol-3-phosphate dehydrogenase (NAD(P)+)
VIFPARLNVTGDLRDLATAEAVLLALPMQALAGFLGQSGGFLNGLPLVVCCKGIDLATLRGPTAIVRDLCPQSAVSILTGPSFAADIARGLPTALTLAGQGVEALQPLLSTATLRLYRSEDAVGAELGGALKNVIAIAAGMAEGMGFGDNSRATLITRGLAEMTRLGVAMGGQPATFAGLAGMGDLIATCTSRHSRNRRAGEMIALGTPADVVEAQIGQTVEGLATVRALLARAEGVGVELPISEQVAAAAFEGRAPAECLRALMSRAPASER